MWRVRRTSLAYQNICNGARVTSFNKGLVSCEVNQSFLILLFEWEYACKLYDDILYILLSKILYDVTSSSSISSLGIMRYCTAVDNRKDEKAWYKKLCRFPYDQYVYSIYIQRSLRIVPSTSASTLYCITDCVIFFLFWFRNSRNIKITFFKHEDKMWFFNVQALQSRDRRKCRGTAYLSRNILSRTKLCIYKFG